MSLGGSIVMQNIIRYEGRIIPVVGTILESLEKSGISIESQCRGGFCGVCTRKIRSGSVVYTTEPLGFMDDDEILTCCSVPKGEVEIEV